MGKFEDFTGRKFGKWTVIERGEVKNKTTYWVCECECGNIKEVRSCDLKSGKSKSCGCKNSEPRKSCEELIGQRFGNLTVVDIVRIVQSGRKRIYCRCKCDCGNTKDIYKRRLLSGEINSCGCLPKIKKSHVKHKECKRHYHTKNDVRISDDIVHVKLSNTNNEMICNLNVWGKCKNYTWQESPKGYARAIIKDGEHRRVIFFHRLAINANNGDIVDHINQNKLDNRLENLRITSNSMNAFNRKSNNESGYNGVNRKQGDKWYATITANGKQLYLGTFNNLQDAINARKKAEIQYYGEYSKKE